MNAIKVDLELTLVDVQNYSPYTLIKRKDNNPYMGAEVETIQYYPVKVHHPNKEDTLYFVKRQDQEIFNDLLKISDDDLDKIRLEAYEEGRKVGRVVYKYKLSHLRRWWIELNNLLHPYQCPECLSKNIGVYPSTCGPAASYCRNCDYLF